MTVANPSGAQSKATMILVFGILGIVCCGLLAPVAWYMGQNDVRMIEAGQLPASTLWTAKAGMICGMVGTGILALYVLVVMLYIAVVGFAAALEALKTPGGLSLPR